MTASGLLLLFGLGSAVEPQPPTEAFRAEHAVLVRELDRVAERVGALPSLSPAAQRREMTELAAFFREHIFEHARWEETSLYAAVDRRMPTRGPEPFTASLRNDHHVVERWVKELEDHAEARTPDAEAFARRADNLLGLVRAHFEAEEDVLLPILDRTMTSEEFQREVRPSPRNGRPPAPR